MYYLACNKNAFLTTGIQKIQRLKSGYYRNPDMRSKRTDAYNDGVMYRFGESCSRDCGTYGSRPNQIGPVKEVTLPMERESG